MQYPAHVLLAISLALFFLFVFAPRSAEAKLRIGTAMADVTGPTADVNFMGYAMMGQVGGGLHIRLRARAFILESNVSATPGKAGRFAFVSVDMGMGSHAVTERVLQILDAEPTTKGIYTYGTYFEFEKRS